MLWVKRVNGLEKHPTTQRQRRLVIPLGHAHYLLEMKGSFESKDVDVLGIEVDDETSKQVVIDVLASDVNAPKVRGELLPQHT